MISQKEITKEDIKEAYRILESVGIQKIDSQTMMIIHVMMDYPKKKMKEKEYLNFIEKTLGVKK